MRRIAAHSIDWLVFAVWAVSVFGAVWWGTAGSTSWWPREPLLAQLYGATLTTAPFALYFALTEGSRAQASLGKRVLGLRIARSDGVGPVGIGRALLRASIKFVPWECGHGLAWQLMALEDGASVPWFGWILLVLAGGGSLWFVAAIAAPGSGRTPYDALAGTTVVSASG